MVVEIDFNGNVFETRAGIFNLSVYNLKAVCVELDQVIHANTNYNFDVWLADGRAGSLLRMMDSFVTDNTTAAAFQIAMWEIAYDHAAGNADDLTSGIFEYTDNATIANLANGLLASTANKSGLYGYLRSDDTQDLVVVPEPASLTALGVGLVGAILRRRRKS